MTAAGRVGVSFQGCIISVLICGSVGLVGLGPLFCQSDVLSQSERKARGILKKTVEALGGQAYLATRNITMEGKVFQFRRDSLRGSGKFLLFEEHPLKRRLELNKGKIVLINNGDQGWKIEYKNITDQTPEEIRNFRIKMKHSLGHILRLRRGEKDMKFRYLGKSRFHIINVEGVKLIDAEGDEIKIYVNSRTSLPVKMEFESPPRGKRWASEDERLFHNYHVVGGVKIPFTIILNSNGYKFSEMQLTSAVINSNLSESLFSSPQK